MGCIMHDAVLFNDASTRDDAGLCRITAEAGTFWLARDIDPPEELERMVFSNIDLWFVS